MVIMLTPDFCGVDGVFSPSNCCHGAIHVISRQMCHWSVQYFYA